MSDEKPVERIGPSGLSAAQIHKLIQETGFKPRPMFTDREVVRRVIDSLVEQGKLRVVEEVDLKGNDYDCLLQCTSCNWGIGWHIEEDLEPMKFCPGCGNKIRR